MNPLMFKAHPLLTKWIEFITAPSSLGLNGVIYLLAVLAGSNLLWAASLPWLLRKIEHLSISPLRAYLLALPATFLYAPLMLTLLEDVLHHAFEFQHRWFLLFALFISSQLLAALYAFALRHERSGQPIGLESGLAVALFMLLASMPASLILLGIHELFTLF